MDVFNSFIVDTLGLVHLPAYLSTTLVSCAFFSLVAGWGSPLLSQAVLGKTYEAFLKKEGKRGRNAWACHVTSQVHAMIIIPLSLLALNHVKEKQLDPVFVFDEAAALTNAVATGYFMWDTVDAIVNFEDIGFVLHGAACLGIYAMSFKPFLMFFGPQCLMWEISTLFLNPRWFSLKILSAARTSEHDTSTLSPSARKLFQIVEVVSTAGLMASFLFVRIIWGGMISIHFWQMFLPLHEKRVLAWPYYSIAVGNILLNGLNVTCHNSKSNKKKVVVNGKAKELKSNGFSH
ncbi:TLC domain-containing protein [Flagelloscypha sp. PMI_526]|nr:TLC domain-containing protein [Flagelloscypha sp. PMI_526]